MDGGQSVKSLHEEGLVIDEANCHQRMREASYGLWLVVDLIAYQLTYRNVPSIVADPIYHVDTKDTVILVRDGEHRSRVVLLDAIHFQVLTIVPLLEYELLGAECVPLELEVLIVLLADGQEYFGVLGEDDFHNLKKLVLSSYADCLYFDEVT